MIHVKRGKEPAELRSAPVMMEMRRAHAFYKQPIKSRSQRRYPAKLVPSRVKGLREALGKMFADKCAYCESALGHTHTFDVENFRPKAGAYGLDGSFSADHYWWLAFEWTNLLPACADCNRTKASRFPIRHQRARFGATGEALRMEGPLLLDPCEPELRPECVLIFDKEGRVASGDERGRTSIECLGLNRSHLVSARKKAYAQLESRFQSFASLDALLEKTVAPVGSRQLRDAQAFSQRELNALFAEVLQPDREYLAMKRQFAQQWAADLARERPRLAAALRPLTSLRTSLTEMPEAPPPEARQRVAARKVEQFEDEQKRREQFSVESEARDQKEGYYLKQRLIERVVIHNFKSIHDLELTFPPAPPQEKVSWLLLLGENATGKTSVLQAVALTLMGEKVRRQLTPPDSKASGSRPALRAGDFVRRGCESGFVKVYLTNTPEPVELHFRKGAREFEPAPPGQAQPRVLSTAYGATRLMPRRGAHRGLAHKASKPFNLFDPFAPLIDADKWLYGLSDEVPEQRMVSQFELAARDMRTLLLLKGRERLRKGEGGEIRVRLFGGDVGIAELSEGYRSVVALAADIMSVMHFRWESMEAAEGIVLVDEIDSHLHPRWKMMLVGRLRSVFPHVQFLVTSHDPLSLRGLHKDEVVVMRRDSRHRPFALTNLPAPDAMRVEQILTSEFFGLNSTIDPEVEEKFDEYYELLALDRRTKTQQARLEELKEELKGLKQLGDTRRERLMLEAADEYLSKQAKGVEAADGNRLKASTRAKIAALWTRRVK